MTAKLNDRQREAVEWGDGPMLILAGAGSGKTRVLTHRIAQLITRRGVHPSQIFAVTFTNKAAAEMRERVMHLLNEDPRFRVREDELWVSTFHSACVRILRTEAPRLGYPRQFSIYDDADQLSVVKACMKELNVSDSFISPKTLQAKINKVKNDGQDHTTYKSAFGGPVEDAFIRVFERYQEQLRLAGSVDFADLILLTVKLLQTQPDVLAAYQRRFPYLLIDEYQDTNKCQYLLMKLLAGPHANLCAVGDEDQSIYRWRGADITNILNFEKDFPNARIFKLEENYRSTRNIIEAASAVISHNTERRDKQLWTQNEPGDKIRLVEAYDEHDESLKVSQAVEASLQLGNSLNQMAIFYRTNAQSRVLEDILRTKGINYAIYGGLKFYARLEVKDALAYLRLAANTADDVSFRRIINVPARGIGAVSLEKFSRAALDAGITHYQLLTDLCTGVADVDLGRTRKGFEKFFELIESVRRQKDKLLPSDLLMFVLEESGYRQSLAEERTTEAQSRLENLMELKQSIVEYELRCGAEKPNEPITLEGFLEQIALVSDLDTFDPNAPAIKLMTIHMAKGLEFDEVFIVGLEEELFPNIRTWEGEEPGEVEEERRLFYVGMTRARKLLTLFYAKNRTVFGNSQFRVISRFIDEIPPDYLEMKKADYFGRRRNFVERPGLIPGRDSFDAEFSQIRHDVDEFPESGGEDDIHEMRAGKRVVHPIFGEGVVKQLVGKDKLLVEFRRSGLKKISLKFAQLKDL